MKKLITVLVIVTFLVSFVGCDKLSLDDKCAPCEYEKFQAKIDELQGALDSANTMVEHLRADLDKAKAEKQELLEQNEVLRAELTQPLETMHTLPAPVIQQGMAMTITFESNRLYNKKRTAMVAQNIVDFAKRHGNKNVKITVEGYSSHDGPADYNMWLSKERAEGVAHKIFSLGNDNNDMNVSIVAHGETGPDVRGVVVIAEIIS